MLASTAPSPNLTQLWPVRRRPSASPGATAYRFESYLTSRNLMTGEATANTNESARVVAVLLRSACSINGDGSTPLSPIAPQPRFDFVRWREVNRVALRDQSHRRFDADPETSEIAEQGGDELDLLPRVHEHEVRIVPVAEPCAGQVCQGPAAEEDGLRESVLVYRSSPSAHEQPHLEGPRCPSDLAICVGPDDVGVRGVDAITRVQAIGQDLRARVDEAALGGFGPDGRIEALVTCERGDPTLEHLGDRVLIAVEMLDQVIAVEDGTTQVKQKRNGAVGPGCVSTR